MSLNVLRLSRASLQPQDPTLCAGEHAFRMTPSAFSHTFSNSTKKQTRPNMFADQAEQRLGLADKPAHTHSKPAAQFTAGPSGPTLSPDAMYEPSFVTTSTNTPDTALPAASSTPATPNPNNSRISDHTSTAPHPHAGQSQQRPGADAQLTSGGPDSSHQQAAGSASRQAVPSSSSAAEGAPQGEEGRPVPVGLDRAIHVFTREAAAAAEASTRCAPAPSAVDLLS